MLFEDLKKENMLALKNKDAAARSILPIVINKAMLVKIDKREKGEELLDTDVITVINKTIKELDEEIAAFKTAGRDKQVEELTEQKKVICHNAQKRAERLSPDIVVNQLIEYYKKVINDFKTREEKK